MEVLLRTPVSRAPALAIFGAGETFHAPHLIDLEVAAVLRRLARLGVIGDARASTTLSDLRAMRLGRYPHTALLPRIWALRDNVTAHDASHVALADLLGAILFTRDQRLGKAAGHLVRIEVIGDAPG